MKIFLKNFLIAIPIALGAIMTMFSVALAMDLNGVNNGFWAIVLGLIGIPTLFASIQNISKE